MSTFQDKITTLVSDQIATIAHPTIGLVTEFLHDKGQAVVILPSPMGKQNHKLYLPWIKQPNGVFLPDPLVGTKVIVGYRGGNISYPYISSIYDEDTKSTIETSIKNDNRVNTSVTTRKAKI